MIAVFGLCFCLLAGGLPAAAQTGAASGAAGEMQEVTLTRAAMLGLGFLLMVVVAWTSHLGRRARRHAAELASANACLQEEVAQRVRAEREQELHKQELESGAQSLALTNALLAEASGRFQELFQGLPVACVCCDQTGRIMEWNRAFEHLYGIENPLGRRAAELLHGSEASETAPLLAAIDAALAGEAQEGVEWTYRRPDGSRLQIYSSLFPQRGADGKILGAVSADVDISAQQEAEDALRQSEERLHALYNTTSRQELTFAEKTEALLEMGRAQFGLEIGVLACIEDESYKVIQAASPGDCLPCGLTLPVSTTYCQEALLHADAVSFEHAGETERRGTEAYQLSGLEAYIGTPVRVDGAVWGGLCFAGKQPHPRLFTSGDRELVRLMAQWIGGEIARRQAEDAVQASEARFRTAIAAMSEGLVVMGSDGVIHLWNDSAERILERTQSEMRGWQPLNPAFAAVREDGTSFPEGSYPLMVSLRRGETQRDVVMGLPRDGGRMLWVSVNARPLFPADAGPDALPSAVVATFADITERRRAEDVIAAQMEQIKEYTGVLEVQKRELEAINAELETLALRDGLTGLSNRRAFGQRVTLEMGRATRYGTPLSLLLLDVDQFKEYNDTFGHVAGDEVLKTLSQVLQIQGRETDFCARYGGEEFVVILPHTDSAGALVMAERLRQAVAKAPWPARPVTASIGAATLLPGMDTEDSLVSVADDALYAAKAAGRNCIVHALSLQNPTAADADEALLTASR